jgi:hypothetical protein
VFYFCLLRIQTNLSKKVHNVKKKKKKKKKKNGEVSFGGRKHDLKHGETEKEEEDKDPNHTVVYLLL